MMVPAIIRDKKGLLDSHINNCLFSQDSRMKGGYSQLGPSNDDKCAYTPLIARDGIIGIFLTFYNIESRRLSGF